MKTIPINSAEAVIEPFHDPQLSELSQWTVTGDGVTGFKFWQNWLWVQCAWERPAADGRVVRFFRAREFDCSGYDRIIVNAASPEGGWFTLHAETGLCTGDEVQSPPHVWHLDDRSAPAYVVGVQPVPGASDQASLPTRVSPIVPRIDAVAA